ncbi:hypothetical protein [Halorussus caseinilyticus]|uniref:Amphi-Trp domain-containing protein n=1 Tax=Halorussus caseinilyticus TaxID=3034025 RepID=A0ABD5WS58_9EURY|nr:hypothetical protein [Halorussus sp. DT72]
MGEDADERDFERELRDLLLTAFAEGVEISGERELRTVPDRIPDWRVTVERRDEERPTSARRLGESP